MASPDKSHDTGLRIIEVLKILLDEDVDKETIIEKLKINNDISNAYTHEAYLKYFNTLQELGFIIDKTDAGFSLRHALLNIELSTEEEKVLFKLIHSIFKLNNKKQEDIIKKFIYRIDKYVNQDLKAELTKIENEPVDDILKLNMLNTLKHAVDNNLEVILSIKKTNGKIETISAEIKKIIEEKENFFILCRNSSMSRNKRIPMKSIIHIQQTEKEVQNFNTDNTVIFEVYGRLAKAYKLKSWETLGNFGTGFLQIINTQEDYDTLMTRLLKYGENCKIIKPQHLVDNFLALTNEILSNLEENSWQK